MTPEEKAAEKVRRDRDYDGNGRVEIPGGATVTPDELRNALAAWRDNTFAALIAVAVELAANRHPEEIRRALASVFDLKAVETMTRRMTAGVENMHRRMTEAKALIEEVYDDLDRLEKRIDRLSEALERAEQTQEAKG